MSLTGKAYNGRSYGFGPILLMREYQRTGTSTKIGLSASVRLIAGEWQGGEWGSLSTPVFLALAGAVAE